MNDTAGSRSLMSGPPRLRVVDRPCALLLFVTLWLAAATAGNAQEAQSIPGVGKAIATRGQTLHVDDPVTSGREALDESADYPWYDTQKDDVRRINIRTEESTTTTTTPVRSSGTGAGLEGLAWVAIALVLVALVAVIVIAVLKREDAAAIDGGHEAEEDVRNAADRVEQLPFPVRKPTGDLLDEARRQYEQGNYGEAIVYLFSHQLVSLDKNQWIHLTKGKTNRQYLGEVRRADGIYEILGRTMIAFEDVFFGHHNLNRDRFEACWSQVNRFEQLAGQAPA